MEKKSILGFILLFFITPILSQAEVLFLGPSEFIPYEEGQGYRRSVFYGLYMPTDGPSMYAHYFTAIHLPEGAKITAVTLFYIDNCNGYISFWVSRQKQYDQSSSPDYIISGSTSGEVAGWRNTKFTNVNTVYNKILNDSCTYAVELYFSGIPQYYDALSFHGIKIFYNLP